MKQITKLAMASLLIANAANVVASPMNGWYAGLMVGATLSPNINNTFYNPYYSFTPTVTGANINSEIKYKSGINGGAQLGYRYCNFRFEGEFLYVHSKWKSWAFGNNFFNNTETLALPKLNAYTQFGAGIFNVYYEFYDPDSDPVFAPYLGLGLGYGHGENRIRFERQTWHTPVETKFTQKAPLGQIILGLAYYQTDYISYGLDYRFITTSTIKGFDARIKNNSINLSFNYTFCESD